MPGPSPLSAPPFRRRRAVASAAAAAAMAAALLVPSGATAAVGDLPDPVAAYPLTVDASDAMGGATGTPVGSITFGAEGAALPGGSGSTTNYIELPGSAFVGRDEFTVSLWVKAVTGSGNYSAMFVGTPAQANNLPAHYWLLNPRNPSGNFKTVVTDGTATSAPWSTEVGPAGPSTVGYSGVWTQYTTVIADNAITGYINGVRIGSAARTDAFSGFGADLQAYLGRSNYLGDQTWAGSILDVRVYDGALDDATVADVFADAQDAATEAIVVDQAAGALDLGVTGTVSTDLTLPIAGAFGTEVSWASSDEAAISTSGAVTLGATEASVTLTATVTSAGSGASTTREFVLTVPAAPADADEAAAALALPYVLAGGDVLPSSVLGADVTWESSDASHVAGTDVVGTASGLVAATLTATVALDSTTATRAFPVMIGEADPAFAVSYTRTPASYITSAMHLALSTDGAAYAPLNHDQGVLFASADFEADPLNGVDKQLVDPYVFRMEDGSFGVVATRTGANEAVDATASSSVLLFTSDDLISYTEVGLVDLGTELDVSSPTVVFDGASGDYLIGWHGSDGGDYVSATMDFTTVAPAVPGTVAARPAADTGLSGIRAGGTVVLTQAEAATLTQRFDYVTNTTVDAPASTTVAYGGDVPSDLGEVLAHYNDGTTATLPVAWDAAELAAIDTNVPGSYTVNGDVKVADYDFPLVGDRLADPDIVLYDDTYYLIATNDGGIAPPGGTGRGQAGLFIRQADTIEDLGSAPREWILTDTTNLAWAPEIHELDGHWYLNWARGTSWNQVKSTVVPLKDGGDPAVQDDWDWAAMAEVRRADGSSIQPNGITLDMTYFEVEGQWYAMWSDRIITPTIGSADLKIATIDPADPTRLTSDPVTIIRPQYGWDRNSTYVVEGPYALLHDGKVVLSISGAATDTTYAVGQIEADVTADLLDPASWSRSNAALLNSANIAGQAGPGHNAYFTDKDGQLLTAIHARGSNGRQTGVRAVHWGASGNLVLDMTADRQVLPENRAVTATVVVEEAPPVTFSDVTELNTAFFSEISWLAAQGISKGWANGDGSFEFRPFNEITRDAMAAFLYRLAGSPEVTLPAVSPFSDVTPSSTQFYTEIVWMFQEGISKGWANKDGSFEFRPFEPISRDAIAAFLYRYAGEPEWTDPVTSPFTDVTSTNTQFYTEITWLADTGITTGWADGTFRPFNEVTRDAMAAFLYRYAHM